MKWIRLQGKLGTDSRRGFTIYEMLVATMVASVALLTTTMIATQMSTQMRGDRARLSSQDNARIAIDEITRILRAAGSNADQSRGQKRFVHAGPWTVGINANLFPVDDPTGTAKPAALDPGLGEINVPLSDGLYYSPPRAFNGGAETIVLTVDSDRDGYISSSDAADDEEEESENPNDLVLKAYIYGSDGAKNFENEMPLALLRGPWPGGAKGEPPPPLFAYWIDDDNDAATPALLHGDTDGDGELSASELYSLGPVPDEQLPLIVKVDATATAESEKSTGSDHASWNTLTSSVTFRNRLTTASRVLGVVFHDFNQNGLRDPGEVPLSNVVVTCSNGYKQKTNTAGMYNFVIPPGTYTITEIDHVGYRSTTPNVVSVNPAPGDYVELNFGDLSTMGTGFIHGHVYEDENRNAVRDVGERGLEGSRIFLDTGVETRTDSTGAYRFTVSVGHYTVTEVDSIGWGSTTPNVLDVTLASNGDSVQADYGDYFLKSSGQIEGIVYLDENEDGVHDTNEMGIPNVTILLDDAEMTLTDVNGEFSFTTSPGNHNVTEVDPPDHTSSTVNTVNVNVQQDNVVYVAFGDIGKQDVSFQEIQLADTERALSISTGDLGEDGRGDSDLILGTHYVSGSNDILVWFNGRLNSGTPNSAIFAQTPTFQRRINADVNAVGNADFSADGRIDVLTGLGTSASNVPVWITLTSGDLPNSPNVFYSAKLATSVNRVVTGDFDADGGTDFAIGTTTGIGAGRLEIFHGVGGSKFVQADQDIYTSFSVFDGKIYALETLGEVFALDAADFTGDGIDDLVVGARSGASQSYVYLLASASNDSLALLSTQPYFVQARIPVLGQVHDVLALDMMEDDGGDIDIVVAAELTTTSGIVEVWHNRGNNRFGFGDIPETIPNDKIDPEGTPLSMVSLFADNDIFPDIIVGTRIDNAYNGKVVLYRAFGFLPDVGELLSGADVGEVVTMTAGDFNKDGASDLATGTRTAASTGKVVVFFNTAVGL